MNQIKSSNIFRALKIIWQSSPIWSVINGGVIILKGVMPLLLIFIIQMLVDRVTIVIGSDKHDRGMYEMFYILLFAGIVFVVNSILSAVSGIVSEKHSYYFNDAILDLIHQRTVKLDFANYDDYNFQNVYYRAINEAAYRPSRIYYGFIRMIQNTITLVLIAGLLMSLHWFVLVLLVVISILVVYIRLNYSKKTYEFKQSHTEEERYVSYYNRLLTGKEFAKELRVFNLSRLFKERYEGEKRSLRKKQFSMLMLKTKYEIIVQLLTAIALIIVFGYISKQAVDGKITQGQMVMFFMALYRGYSFLQDLLGRISGLYEDGLFLRNLFEFIDYKVVQSEHSKTKQFPKQLKKGICIKNLRFSYVNSSRHVFDNVNIKIEPSETVAIVGANGAGKSTLVKLLCGLYRPQEGCITFDDVDLNDIRTESLAKNVSVVFQDFMLYNLSAKENIWLGNVDKDPNDAGIPESAEKSGINKMLEKLPNGFETTLGTLFKDSEMLSVGEWQRIALSRSFFNDAQLVILDEPTSSLDAFTEARLIENFKAIVRDRTAIIVSHRFSTIKMADRVIVLNEHGVAEEGTFNKLIQQKGVLYEMVKSMRESSVLH